MVTRTVKKKKPETNKSSWQKQNNFARAAHFFLYTSVIIFNG